MQIRYIAAHVEFLKRLEFTKSRKGKAPGLCRSRDDQDSMMFLSSGRIAVSRLVSISRERTDSLRVAASNCEVCFSNLLRAPREQLSYLCTCVCVRGVLELAVRPDHSRATTRFYRRLNGAVDHYCNFSIKRNFQLSRSDIARGCTCVAPSCIVNTVLDGELRAPGISVREMRRDSPREKESGTGFVFFLTSLTFGDWEAYFQAITVLLLPVTERERDVYLQRPH